MAGCVGCALFLAVFPGSAIPKITHAVLRLPGPGSGVCAVFGPFFIACCVLSASAFERKWSILIAGFAFALLHNIFTPLVYPGVKTVGSVGPFVLRTAAPLIAAAVLEFLSRALGKASPALRFSIAAAAANLALVAFYWAAIYPRTRRGGVEAGNALVLAGAAMVLAVVFGALIPLALARLWKMCGRSRKSA